MTSQPEPTPKTTDPNVGSAAIKKAAATIQACEETAQQQTELFKKRADSAMREYERKMAFYEKLHNQAEDIGGPDRSQ